MATREQVMAALFALIQGTGSFVTASRRLRDPEGLDPAQSPAFFLTKGDEEYVRPSPSLPPKRILTALASLYNDVGQDENLIPETPINNALDALDAALKAGLTADGRFTLGGLVYSAVIDGQVTAASGDITGKCLAVVPIKITLP